MSDEQISSVNRVGYTPFSYTGYTPAGAARPVDGAQVDSAAQARMQAPQPADKQAAKRSNVSLLFKVDPGSNDLTIFVLDRDNRKVLRTIPPEEINHMDPGDLLELFM